MSSNTKNPHLKFNIVLKRIQIGIIFEEGLLKLVGKRKLILKKLENLKKINIYIYN